jgi:hypothetical protein
MNYFFSRTKHWVSIVIWNSHLLKVIPLQLEVIIHFVFYFIWTKLNIQRIWRWKMNLNEVANIFHDNGLRALHSDLSITYTLINLDDNEKVFDLDVWTVLWHVSTMTMYKKNKEMWNKIKGKKFKSENIVTKCKYLIFLIRFM